MVTSAGNSFNQNSITRVFSSPKVVIIGDSIGNQNATISSGNMENGLRWFTYLGMMMGKPWVHNNRAEFFNPYTRHGHNQAVGGEDVLEEYNALSSRLVGIDNIDVVFDVCGTNSLNGGNGDTEAEILQLFEYKKAIWNKCLEKGAEVFVLPIFPRNYCDGASGWTTSYPNSATYARRINEWAREYAKNTKKISYLNVEHVIMDVYGNAYPDSTIEGVHPNTNGSWKIAKAIYNEIGHRFQHKKNNFSPSYAATYNIYGSLLDGTFSATAGTITGAGGSFPSTNITGTVPTGFSLYNSTAEAANTTCVSSVISRDDGINGKMWRMVYSTTGLKGVTSSLGYNEEIRIRTNPSTITSNVVAGADYICGFNLRKKASTNGLKPVTNIYVDLVDATAVITTGNIVTASTTSVGATTVSVTNTTGGSITIDSGRIFQFNGDTSIYEATSTLTIGAGATSSLSFKQREGAYGADGSGGLITSIAAATSLVLPAGKKVTIGSSTAQHTGIPNFTVNGVNALNATTLNITNPSASSITLYAGTGFTLSTAAGDKTKYQIPLGTSPVTIAGSSNGSITIERRDGGGTGLAVATVGGETRSGLYTSLVDEDTGWLYFETEPLRLMSTAGLQFQVHFDFDNTCGVDSVTIDIADIFLKRVQYPTVYN